MQGLVLALFLLFSFRLWYLQVHKGDYYAEKARENRLQFQPIYAPRGLIRDRQGVLLAINEPAYALAIVREESPNLDAAITQIGQWTGIAFEDLKTDLKRGRVRMKSFEPQILVPNLSLELLAQAEGNALDWPELRVVTQPRRFYPQKELLSHVLGYVALANEDELNKDAGLILGDSVGKQGLELVLEKNLRGKRGYRQLEVDVIGRILSDTIGEQPSAGRDLSLSIDLELQRLVAEQMKGQAGAIAVLAPNSGEILAFVSQPGYDPNLFVKGINPTLWNELLNHPQHPMQNRVIQSVYPPGSVFKLVTAGCGLERGNLDPHRTVFCSGGYSMGSRVFRCWKRGGHGTVDLQKAISESCDVYFYQLGERLGIDEISDFAKKCGFGSPTGVELPHEKSGLIPSSAWKQKRYGVQWMGGETLNAAIGQGYTVVTPLQVGRFVAALVNGGDLYQPTLLLGERPVFQGKLPLSDENRKRIIAGMVAAVEGNRGTAGRIRRKGIFIGAKTGTAQVVRMKDEYEGRDTESIPYKHRDHAWMVSFAQQGSRAFVVVVMVEHGGHGSSAAGPPTVAIYNHLFKN